MLSNNPNLGSRPEPYFMVVGMKTGYYGWNHYKESYGLLRSKLKRTKQKGPQRDAYNRSKYEKKKRRITRARQTYM